MIHKQDPRTLSAQTLWQRPVLIGDKTTLLTLAALAESNGIHPVAYIDVDAADGGLAFSGLPALHAAQPFTAALVSLPAASVAALKVRSTLRSLKIPERT